MEGIEGFFRMVSKVILVSFTIGLLVTSIYLYEENKTLKKDNSEHKIELRIMKDLLNKEIKN